MQSAPQEEEENEDAGGDFASLDEFADLLENAGTPEVTSKQKEWESRLKKGKKSQQGSKKSFC